jgi:transposase-like protein
MEMRICDICGEEKEVYGAKSCSNGHFICEDCVKDLKDESNIQNAYDFVIDLIDGELSGPCCPLCKKRLH